MSHQPPIPRRSDSLANNAAQGAPSQSMPGGAVSAQGAPSQSIPGGAVSAQGAPSQSMPGGRHASGALTPIVALRGVTKIYGKDEATRVIALNNLDLDVFEGQFTSIMGPSGSGKSTLLHCLAGLDAVSRGSVNIGGVEITRLKDKDLTHFRRDKIGFVFQSFNLVPTIDAKANIVLPLRLAGRKVDEGWMRQVVKTLDLEGRLNHKPHELSGGQQQRVAVARALVSRPAVVVADEPTGNLDTASSSEVLNLLRGAVDELGQTVIMVTHDMAAAALADRTLIVRDGRIVADLANPTVDKIAEVTR